MAVLLLNTAILLVCFEVAASFIIEILDAINDVEWRQEKTSLSYYAAESWADAYWYDHAHLQEEYAPYVIWRQRPYAGEAITIDAQGHRLTPGASCRQGAYRVFVFGGSTVWGYGAPDWGTIPAYLQIELAQNRSGPVCVQNFGEMGFVSTQGIIELLQQLQQGMVPDLVLFYDGFNDTAATYQNNRAGAHLNEAHINTLLTPKKTFTGWLQITSTYRLLTRLAVKARLLPPSSDEALLSDREDTAVLSEQVFRAYFTNYQLVVSLAAEYGFAYYFFWQPLPTTGNKSLTAEEQQMVTATSPVNAFHQQVYAEMKNRVADYPCLHNLGHVFDGQAELVWIDDIHVTPAGNEKIAKEMARLIQGQSKSLCGAPGPSLQ